jgi:hypothetical protein
MALIVYELGARLVVMTEALTSRSFRDRELMLGRSNLTKTRVVLMAWVNELVICNQGWIRVGVSPPTKQFFFFRWTMASFELYFSVYFHNILQ